MPEMIIESPSTKTTQTCCQNCGHTSHCGGTKYATFKDYAIDGGEYREVKICEHCRCSECSNKGKKKLANYQIK